MSFYGFKQFVGLEEKKEEGFTDEFSNLSNQACEACTLTRTQRMYGFGFCFAIGWILTLCSAFAITSIATHPTRFAVLYCMGNVIALISTCFLFGPWSQIKNMFKPVRAIATIIYLGAIALTLYVAIAVQQPGPVIICMIVQLLAMIWYCASYIPFGRQVITKCVGGIVGV